MLVYIANKVFYYHIAIYCRQHLNIRYFHTKCTGREVKESEVRLVGGNNPWEGRVKIFSSGIWGTISNSGAGVLEARAICRQLGYNQYSECQSKQQS